MSLQRCFAALKAGGLRLTLAALAAAAWPTAGLAATADAAPPRALALEIPRDYKPIPLIHAAVPAELGCHLETTPGQVRKVDCLTAAQIAQRPHPGPCVGADGDAACGAQSTVTAVQRSFGINKIPITESFLETTLAQYATSTDTQFGPGAYSLQLNTNFFQGNNRAQDWVQFVFQDWPNGGTRFCVWNIDTSTQAYTPTCVGPSSIPLTAREQFTVGGFVCGKGCTYVSHKPSQAVLYGWMHWQTLNANGSVCGGCASGTVWVVAPDTYDLADNWLQISGSILGSGGGSKLNFGSYAVERNVLGATACPIPLSPGWTCATPQLSGQYADTAGWVTAESNNLFYAPNPNWVTPPAPQSSLNCSNGFCWLAAYELYPQH